MTEHDRNLLMEIHTQTALTTKEVKRLSRVIEGNGKPGLLADVAGVMHAQKTCHTRRIEERVNFRWKVGLSVTIIAVIISAITTFTMFFFRGN